MFNKIKSIMCKALVLLQPDFNKKFYLQTDTSAYGMGTVLLQEGETTPSLATHEKPVLHPITYFSATFTLMNATMISTVTQKTVPMFCYFGKTDLA